MSSGRLQLRSADGTTLAARFRRPESPWASVVVCHGHGEHFGRYEHVADALVDAGLAVYGADLRGHGASDGKRGHTMAWSRYVDDVDAVHAAADADGLGALPRFQLGHSMGGLVSIHFALEHRRDLAGLALSGPLLGLAFEVPPLKAWIGRKLSRWLPGLTLPSELDARQISRNPAVVAAYEADPLVHDRISTRAFTEMTAAIDAAHTGAEHLTLPVLLMHGDADGLTDVEASRRFAARLPQAESHFLPGFYHEIFNEPQQAEPLGLLTDWLRRLRPA